MNQLNPKIASFILLLSFVAVGCSSSPSDPAGSSYTPATDIYTKPIEAARMVSHTENDVTYHFVDNQILVFLEEIPMNEDLVATVAATADGTVVGRIPDIGMIQLETASLSVDEIALTIESLEGITGVTAAFPNLMSQLASADACRRSGDLALNLPEDAAAPERCAYEYPDFFNLLPVMRKLQSMGFHLQHDRSDSKRLRIGRAVARAGISVYWQYQSIDYGDNHEPTTKMLDTGEPRDRSAGNRRLVLADQLIIDEAGTLAL